MAKSTKIRQKFEILTSKIFLNNGQNYQLYTSIQTIYGQDHSCKKSKNQMNGTRHMVRSDKIRQKFNLLAPSIILKKVTRSTVDPKQKKIV